MKTKGRICGICLVTVFVIAAILWSMMVRKGSMTFKDSGRVLDNPGRGYYIQIDSAKYEKIPDLNEVRLILLGFDIEEYADGPITDEKLEELRNALTAARHSKKEVIFRAAYGFHENGDEPESLQRIALHVQQIAGVLNDFADTVAVVQAGLYGDYGEWYKSDHLKDNKDETKGNRLFLLQQWENYLDKQLKVSVRRPRFIREAIEAGILKNRLGLHNDALLSTEDDMGTYDEPTMDRGEELLWLSKRSAEQINGGEMPTLGKYSTCQNAHFEFGKLHLTYLNLAYNKEILDQWEKSEFSGSNAKVHIGNHLGYRLYISGIKFKKPILSWMFPKTECCMEIEICNSGYAAVDKQYDIYAVIKSGDNMQFQKLNPQYLFSISNGEKTKLMIGFPVEQYEVGEEVQIGIKIARNKEEMDFDKCIEFSNEKVMFDKGINYFMTIEKHSMYMKSRLFIQ